VSEQEIWLAHKILEAKTLLYRGTGETLIPAKELALKKLAIERDIRDLAITWLASNK
jgi:hypothetical protein